MRLAVNLRRGVKLGLFGFAFGFGGWLGKSISGKRLGRFFAAWGGANRSKLGSFGFVLSRGTKCPIGRKFLLYLLLCAFDFSKNWVRFFKQGFLFLVFGGLFVSVSAS